MEKFETKKEDIKKLREKESIFVNQTENSEKIVNKFYKFYKYRVKRADFYSFLICGILLVIIGFNFLFKLDIFFGGLIANVIVSLLLVALGVCFIITAFKPQKYDKKRAQKVYDEDISNIVNDYYFDDERVTVINKYGETNRVYQYLEAIYEAKDYYYIFTSKTSVHIMRKDSFKKGTEKEFHKFIKEKMGRHYKKRCIRRREKEKQIEKQPRN